MPRSRCPDRVALIPIFRPFGSIVFYTNEKEDIAKQIENMKNNNEDEYMIGKKGELLQETSSTLEDTKRRIGAAIDKLEMLIEDCGDELVGVKEFDGASESLKFAKSLV